MYQPEKTTPATVRYIDLPGLPEEHRSDTAVNLPELRSADALMVLVRDFENQAVAHPLLTIDPRRDLQRIEDEFVLQDQLVVERRLERLAVDLGKRKVPELERERDLLTRCLGVLEDQRPLRGESFSDNEAKILKGFTFLSSKPLLVVVNTGEEGSDDDPVTDAAWADWRHRPQTALTRVCATLEHELSQLERADAEELMHEYGIVDRALDRIIRESYRLLGAVSFFTVGEDECRAWTVADGTPAVEAAGAIHSDIERGFIRAEVVPVQSLLEAGSLAACRQQGSLRLEGKSYPVTDGEVIHFRFNV
jgi:GTP-binding protein YchF